jgi:ribosome-binding factor A
MKSLYRVNRVRELLHRELSDIVRGLKDPRTRLVTVIDAEITKDLRHAKMFVSLVGSHEEQEDVMRAMYKALGFIRGELSRRVRLKYTPDIQVIYDDSSERASRISAILDGHEKA